MGARRSHHLSLTETCRGLHKPSPQIPNRLTHLHPPPSLAPPGECAAPLAASEPPSGLHPAGSSVSAAAHLPSPALSSPRHFSVRDKEDTDKQPRSLLFQEKPLVCITELLGWGAHTPPDLPAPGDALYKSSAARIRNGKQPLAPGSNRRTHESCQRERAAASLPSPPRSYPLLLRKAPAFQVHRLGTRPQVCAGRCATTQTATEELLFQARDKQAGKKNTICCLIPRGWFTATTDLLPSSSELPCTALRVRSCPLQEPGRALPFWCREPG